MKKYKFTLNNYYDANEINTIAPIVENFVNMLANEDGLATLNLKDDVHIIVKRDEGLVVHMVIDSDTFTALPKTLASAKKFSDTFIKAMAKAVDEKKKATDITAIKTNLENKAENDLLNYIGGTTTPATNTSTVTVNGKPVTDLAEKEKVISEIDKNIADTQKYFNDMKAKMAKAFADSFKTFFDTYLGD